MQFSIGLPELLLVLFVSRNYAFSFTISFSQRFNILWLNLHNSQSFHFLTPINRKRHPQNKISSPLIHICAYKMDKDTHTRRKADLFANSSPCSITSRRESGKTFQNSATNSAPFRLLFWRMSFARYRKARRCSRGALWNCLSHVSTTCFALFM